MAPRGNSACAVGTHGNGCDLPGGAGGIGGGIPVSVLHGQDRPSLPGQYLFGYPSITIIGQGLVTARTCDGAEATVYSHYNTGILACTCRNRKIFVNFLDFSAIQQQKMPGVVMTTPGGVNDVVSGIQVFRMHEETSKSACCFSFESKEHESTHGVSY